MAKEQEVQTQDPEMKALLQLLLEDKAEEVKQKQAKKAEEAEKLEASRKLILEAGIAQEEQKARIREGCGHMIIHPATKQRTVAWRAQVNSGDNTFSPVCCLCLTVMPKIKATEYQIKEGVQLDRYAELTTKGLEGWHRNSYPNGCDVQSCHVCHPLKREVKELVTA